MDFGFVGYIVFGLVLLIGLSVIFGGLALIYFIIKGIQKYLKSSTVRNEKNIIKRNLGEVLKVHREECKMTQEFVAEALGVSRQAVSKWETGTSDPSTSNLLAIAKLYNIPIEDLIKEVK